MPSSTVPHASRTAAQALARIAENDARLQAWVHVDAAAAGKPVAAGPLAGMPFGVKDIIDVAGLPTKYGVSFGTECALIDAWCVAALRAAGGVPVGKTHTTPFAYKDPAPTRNPHDAERTPGGSSAGSAASVAAGHVPFALGTQTIGSILRPASFCGIVGFKPTYGTIPVQGVAPFSPTVDHVGVLAADVATAARVVDIFKPGVALAGTAPPRIGYAREAYSSRFEPETVAVLDAAVARLRADGATVEGIELPPAVEASFAHLLSVVAFEAHAVLGAVLHRGLPPEITAMIEQGSGLSYDAYRDALAYRDATRGIVCAALERYDAVLTGTANAAPPRSSTGDTTPLGAWTFYGVPALTLPAGRGAAGLPLGAQLAGAPGTDAALLSAARWIEASLAR